VTAKAEIGRLSFIVKARVELGLAGLVWFKYDPYKNTKETKDDRRQKGASLFPCLAVAEVPEQLAR
jgi:hypothetical protein